MDTINETPRKSKLPEGYDTVEQSGKEINITKSDMPWLKDSTRKVKLAHVKLEDGTEFYLGSIIGHRTLIDEAKNVGKQSESQREVNQAFYKQLKSFSKTDYNPDIPRLQYPKSNKSVFYVKSYTGERTYFMRFNDIDSKHVIIRIAVCNKNGQDRVYRVIATR